MSQYTYFEARYSSNAFVAISAKTIDELKLEVEAKFTYKPTMAPENVIYWENHKRGLTFHKVTVISEQVEI